MDKTLLILKNHLSKYYKISNCQKCNQTKYFCIVIDTSIYSFSVTEKDTCTVSRCNEEIWQFLFYVKKDREIGYANHTPTNILLSDRILEALRPNSVKFIEDI